MKKLAIVLAVSAAGLLNVKPANAQIRLGLNLHFGNVGAHVIVAPPVQDVNYTNYDNDDDYYYLPDVEAYYDVAQQCYYYNDGNQWIHAAYLPGRRDYDWRNARRFEVRARQPYMHHDEYRTRFGGFDQRGGGFDNRYANRGGFEHRDDNRGGFDNRGQQYGQPQNNQYQNGGQQNQNRGNYGQPQQGQGGQYQNGGQQNQGQGRGKGNYGQPAGQNNGGQQNQNHGNAQPQNNGGQQNHDGGNRGEEHFAANKMGMMRPASF